MTRQAAPAATGHRHEGDAEPLDRRQDRAHLVALARVRDREHDILLRHHAQVAVARFGGMDEERRRAGGGERRRDLAADVTALAHAHDDDPPAAREHRLHRGDEAFALARLQALEGARLDVERAPGELEHASCVESRRGRHRCRREGVQ
jgi:hypothetical protein